MGVSWESFGTAVRFISSYALFYVSRHLHSADMILHTLLTFFLIKNTILYIGLSAVS
jgi:hypothetical protein